MSTTTQSMTTKTLVATAWYLETGTRLKGRINTSKCLVYTPYGVYKYEYRMTPHGLRPYFPELCSLEGPSCPLQPEIVEVLHEDQDGDLECYGGALLPPIPRGYKSIVWVSDYVAKATRTNNTTVMMGEQYDAI